MIRRFIDCLIKFKLCVIFVNWSLMSINLLL